MISNQCFEYRSPRLELGAGGGPANGDSFKRPSSPPRPAHSRPGQIRLFVLFVCNVTNSSEREGDALFIYSTAAVVRFRPKSGMASVQSFKRVWHLLLTPPSAATRQHDRVMLTIAGPLSSPPEHPRLAAQYTPCFAENYGPSPVRHRRADKRDGACFSSPNLSV